MVGGFDGGTTLNTAERFVPASNSWEPLPMGSKRRWCCAAVLDGSLYVVGGRDDRAVISTVERFLPASDSWEPQPPMPSKRFACGIAVM